MKTEDNEVAGNETTEPTEKQAPAKGKKAS
jgi:hypothetical protein